MYGELIFRCQVGGRGMWCRNVFKKCIKCFLKSLASLKNVWSGGK